jgi:hypothetical protein
VEQVEKLQLLLLFNHRCLINFMKIPKLVISILALSLNAFTVIGQAPPPPPPAKPVDVVGKAEVFKFPTKSSVTSKFLNRSGSTSLTATFEVLGNQIIRPEGISFIFQNFSKSGLMYMEPQTLRLLLGDKRWVETKATKVMASCKPSDPNDCFEVFFTGPLPTDDIEGRVLTGSVTFLFGETRLALTESEIEGLKDMFRAIEKHR